MEIAKILTADVLDIIFEGKNKSYGAYELRKSYSKRLVLSITLMLTVILLLWVGYLFAGGKDKQMAMTTIDIPVVTLDNIAEKKKPEPLPVLPRTAPRHTVPVDVPTIRNVVPRIVPDDVADTDKPPTVDDMADKRIGSVTTPGDGGTDLQGPSGDGPGGDGVVPGPVANREAVDSIFTKVEIESQYPGGSPAWSRFLNKNVSGRYPQDAIDQGIEGKVVIQFIVDREGNISGIEAVEGPEELRDLAIRTIKKSGKWIPAEQNGNKVKSYKRQPFVFQLPKE